MSFLIIKQPSKLQINSQNHNEKQYRRFQRYMGLKKFKSTTSICKYIVKCDFIGKKIMKF